MNDRMTMPVVWRLYVACFVGVLGCLWGPAEARAKHEILVMQAKGAVQVCHQKCQQRKSWSALPGHLMLSAGDWVSLPVGSTLIYRTVASKAGMKALKGPLKIRLKAQGQVSVSKKLARLWRRVVRLLRGRSHAGTGATRAPKRIVSHPSFVDLLSPRNEERWRRPTHLRWRARKGYQHYQVRLSQLTKKGQERIISQQKVMCQTAICALSLKSVRLQRGAKYVWQVELRHKGRKHTPYPSYGVYFRLLSKATTKRLQDRLRAVGTSAAHRPLYRALTLLQFGCFGEALAALATQKGLHPRLREQLQDAIACAICRPWSIPKRRHRRKQCQCDDDPGRNDSP